MTVKRGQMCCVVGPSGCGKSTLLRAILGLVPLQGGTIHLDESRVLEGIAFVQQDCPLLPWRTAMQNACLGAELRGALSTVIVDRIRRHLVDFGLSGFENSLTSELSGGMRQRVAIARALESRPALLFCDEPFSAVDFVGRLALSSTFKSLCRVSGITTVFVTHNIEEAIFLGDILVVMTGQPGRIKKVYHPQLSVGSEDAVRCRESPEFAGYFQSIWQDLRDSHG
jgi:NitT/TauT family transport system ATP-binding protein